MKRAFLVCALMSLAMSAFGKDAFLVIGGSVSNFRTDMRIFNPSSTKDIQVQATLLPVNINVPNPADNRQALPVTINVPKRQMVAYNDVVQGLFNTTSLGAIHLKSADDFVATQRIYAIQSATVACQIEGTLGQFVPAADLSSAKTAGVLIQLKSNPSFRTNVGLVNPNSANATVTWRLYDKNNALVSTGSPMVIAPLGVLGPTTIAGTVFFTPGSADLSDAWVSFTSDQPVLAYASVVDNGTSDPTFIVMADDTASNSTPTPQTKTYEVTLKSWDISISPAVDLKPGDTAIFRITTLDSTHGFQLADPAGKVLIPSFFLSAAEPAVMRTVSVSASGTYTYLCTKSTCGSGHGSMNGSFVVGAATGDRPGY